METAGKHGLLKMVKKVMVIAFTLALVACAPAQSSASIIWDSRAPPTVVSGDTVTIAPGTSGVLNVAPSRCAR